MEEAAGNGVAQRTIARETSLEGTGLHTGAETRIRFVPAPADHGVCFRRMDMDGQPEVRAALGTVSSTDRGTSIGSGDQRIYTVEHLLAAVSALQLDNLEIQLDGPEVPIVDGSFAPFYALLAEAGAEAQDRPARELVLTEAVTASAPGGASYVATPADELRISATIEFDHPLVRRQFAAFDVTSGEFEREIARARTFGFLNEKDALNSRGLARGVTRDNVIVLDPEGGLIAGGELRFRDEFVRHKIGDMVGDLALLGARLRAHIVATRPSHAGNLELARKIAGAARGGDRAIVDITRIMQHLPHRYPMLLVDRIIDFEPGRRIVGIKNVTINEPFFQGHYPGHPVMPGVLIIEAMAQVGGLLLMDAVENPEEKVVYFMSLDNVKWRRPITPGDQIRFELEMLSLRRHVCRMRGEGYVDGKLVAEAEMMARIVDR
jgi:UDP-3-O-[3-hydroxymyristoyl] N-acetylglucosamine deacetylase/3-hydroxyacyl-[acyl-carrier-protein] dehydratase